MGISIPTLKMGILNVVERLCNTTAPEHQISFDIQTSAQPAACRRSIKLVDHDVHLPMEIVISILEATYYGDDLQPNRPLLKACSLVCKDWCATSQKLLFRDVTLRTQDAYRAFKRAIDGTTERGRMLSQAVVRLHVTLDPSQPRHLYPQSFARAVSLCPNLYELQVALYGYRERRSPVGDAGDERLRPTGSFDNHTLSLLRSGPKITALRFDNWSENRQAMAPLLDIYSPTLKYLSMSGTAPERLPTPFQGSLAEVRMNFLVEPALEFTDSLLLHSSSSLRSLELEREPSTDLFKHLIHNHCSTLESLTIPVCGNFDHAIALKQCTKLRELKIESPWVSPMVFRHLSEHIEHIAVGVDAGTALQPVIDAVKSRKEMRAVTLQMWQGGESHPLISTLKVACAFRGLELKLTRDVRAFRQIARGDPVSSSCFPRVKSLENLHLMRSC